MTLFHDFNETSASYLNDPEDYELLVPILEELIMNTKDMRQECGVAIGPITFRKKTPSE